MPVKSDRRTTVFGQYNTAVNTLINISTSILHIANGILVLPVIYEKTIIKLITQNKIIPDVIKYIVATPERFLANITNAKIIFINNPRKDQRPALAIILALSP